MDISYTNKSGIPEPLALAIQEIDGDYSTGESDFTTTELTGPPRIRALKLLLKKRKEKIVHDVSDLLHSVMGQAVHFILQRWAQKDPNYVTEARYYNDFAGYKIGGQLDLYHTPTGRMWDWKYTKYFTYKNGVKAEYVQQLNINAWLLRANDITPKHLYSAPIYRDFSKLLAAVKQPFKHADEFGVAIWPDEAIESLLRKRIELHLQAEKELPLCSEEERWATPSIWAAQSLKSGRAIKNGRCSTQEEAEEKRLAHKSPNTLGVVYRPGKSTRCEHYCPVAGNCSQWAENPTNPANAKEAQMNPSPLEEPELF